MCHLRERVPRRTTALPCATPRCPATVLRWRRRVESESEHFLDVSGWTAPAVAARMAADGLHVALNLNGYTKVRGRAAVLSAVMWCAVLRIRVCHAAPACTPSCCAGLHLVHNLHGCAS